ncbi:MAG TPA: HEAT repeat domain-containing protein [Pirellulales bacterium]|nr:HEAT repeat domain-containing protein [Pirellulales bacterium]
MAKRFAQLISFLTPKRRWVQFRLGTMLLVVTVFCLWLGDYVNPIRRLERKLRDPNDYVRELAAESLGNLGGDARSATRSLLHAMRDESDGVRSKAAWAFSRVGGRAELLVPFLADSAGEVWLPAAEGIVWAGGDPAMVVRTLLDGRSKQDNYDWNELFASMGAEQAATVVTLLLDAMAANDDSKSLAASCALDKLSLPAASVAPALIVRLDHERPDVRIAAAEQLLRLGPAAKQATAALREGLHDPDVKVATAMAAALGAVDPGDPDFIAVLTQSLRADDPSLRELAVNHLDVLGPIAAGTSDELVVALDGSPEAFQYGYGSRPPSVADVAANSLLRIGPAAVPALERALKQANPRIRKAAAIILGKCKPLAGSSMPTWVAALDDGILDVRTHAIRALGAIGKDAAPAVPRLAKFLDSEHEWVRISTYCALAGIGVLDETSRSRLTAALTANSRRERYEAAHALAACGEPVDQILPTMIELATSDGFFRNEALEYLETMGPAAAPATGPLSQLLTQSKANGYEDVGNVELAGRALAAIGPAAVAGLTAALRNRDPGVRQVAARSLGEIGPAAGASIPSLLGLLDDKGLWVYHMTEVRWAVAEALGRMGREDVAVPVLLRLLEEMRNADYDARETLIGALGRIGPGARDAIPAIVRFVDRGDRDVTDAVAIAVAKIDPSSPSLVPCLKLSMASRARRSQTDKPDDRDEGFLRVAETIWELGPRAAALLPELRRMVFTAPLLDVQSRCYAAFALARFASERQAAARYLEQIASEQIGLSGHYFHYRYDDVFIDFERLLQRIKDAPLEPASD